MPHTWTGDTHMAFVAVSGMFPVQNVRHVSGPYLTRTPPSPYVAMLFVRFCIESKRLNINETAIFVTDHAYSRISFFRSFSSRGMLCGSQESERDDRPLLQCPLNSDAVPDRAC